MAVYKHKIRNNGDTILAEEWNAIGQKVENLNEKFDQMRESRVRNPYNLRLAGVHHRWSGDSHRLVCKEQTGRHARLLLEQPHVLLPLSHFGLLLSPHSLLLLKFLL